MPVPPLDDPQLVRTVDERPRTYRHATPGSAAVVVDLAGAGDPVTVALDRGLASSRVLGLSYEEAWALWACLGDGLGVVSGDQPGWLAESLDPTDPDGYPLPALPT
jgi:hypothetical protein